MKIVALLSFLLPSILMSQMALTNGKDLRNGIFFGKESLPMYPTVLSGIQNKNTVFFMLSLGIAPMKRVPFLSFAKSNHIVAESQFLFVFENPRNESGFLEPERSFRGAISPNEFLLLKLRSNTKSNVRSVLHQLNGWSSRIKAEAIPFSFSETHAGIFEVFPLDDLAPGEYGFVHKDIMNSFDFSDFMIFDFSVE